MTVDTYGDIILINLVIINDSQDTFLINDTSLINKQIRYRKSIDPNDFYLRGYGVYQDMGFVTNIMKMVAPKERINISINVDTKKVMLTEGLTTLEFGLDIGVYKYFNDLQYLTKSTNDSSSTVMFRTNEDFLKLYDNSKTISLGWTKIRIKK